MPTYGCLNGFKKVSSATLDAWSRLLAETPPSRLLLHAPEGSCRRRVLDRMAAHGVEENRIEFVGPQPMTEYMRTYQRIDVALDPFPWGGGITTCDALWMGVPVVTLSGRTAVGRGGRSLVSNIGLPELVAYRTDEYIKIAADWKRWIPPRPTLRQRMLQSPLMDGIRFGLDMEAAFRKMWRSWCEEKKI